MPTIHLIIKGTVQGVFYRATAKKIAEQLGVRGWVKNTEDENVEALVTGTERQLEEFISWCKKGPAKAKVTDVIALPHPETEFADFLVRR